MSVLTVYASAGDGRVSNSTSDFSAGGWDTMKSAASGNAVDYTSTGGYVQSYQSGDRGLTHLYLSFDTSGLPDDCTITSAYISLYVTGVDLFNDSNQDNVVVVGHTAASTSSLSLTDWAQIGATKLSSYYSLSGLTQNAYNNFTLNADGLAALSLTGFSKFAFRKYEISRNSIDPEPPVGFSDMQVSMSEETGTSQDPKLVITYIDNTTTSTSSSTSTTVTTSSTSTTVSSTSSSTTTTSTSTTTTSTSTTSTTISTSTTTTSTTTTSSSTTTTSSSTTMPFSIAVDNV